MSPTVAPPTPEEWTSRLWKFAQRLPRKDAQDLADDLDTLADDLDEIMEVIPDLKDQLTTWADDGADRQERADAKDEVDTLVNDLHSRLRRLAGILGTFPKDYEALG